MADFKVEVGIIRVYVNTGVKLLREQFTRKRLDFTLQIDQASAARPV